MDLINVLPRLSEEVPSPFRKAFTIPVSAGVVESLSRRGTDLVNYERAAFDSFLWASGIFLPIALLILLLMPFPYSMLSACAVTLVFAIPAWVLSIPSRTYKEDQRTFLLDSPAVVGSMTMSMNRTPSLERALEAGSRSGKGALCSSLARVSWRSLTGEAIDLRMGVSSWTAALHTMNEGLRRSMHLIMAAEEEGEREGRDRLLDRANLLVMEGLKEACERYVGSLSFPVMLVFAFGVLTPVMLFSLIPLLGMEGGKMDLTTLALMLLVLMPSVTLAYTRVMISRSPLRQPSSRMPVGKVPLAMFASAIIAFAPINLMTGSAAFSSVVSLGLLLAGLCLSGGGKVRNEEDASRSFVDGLYQLGNAMLGGKDLEAAFLESAKTEEGAFNRWAMRIVHFTMTDRLSLAEVVRNDDELMSLDPALQQSYLTVMDCAREDHRGAGKLAVNLAQCQNDMSRAKRKMRESLRSVVDMMGSTSLVFAPGIIGLTSGIMGMLGGDRDWLMALASVYVVELAFLVNYFTSNLDGWRTGSKRLWNYGKRGGVALAVFLTASLCGQFLLFRLL